MKKNRYLLALKRLIWGIKNERSGITIFDIVQTFPAFAPNGLGSYQAMEPLIIESINRTIPLLCKLPLGEGCLNLQPSISPIGSISLNEVQLSRAFILRDLFNKYGSDKARRHDYHGLYAALLGDPDRVASLFEVGLGTNNTRVVSNMGVTGRPGASLRAFRDYLPNAEIYGADIDPECLFAENRISTYQVDQTDPEALNSLLGSLLSKFDLIIDDGLHAPYANLVVLEAGLNYLKPGGYIVIEDIDKASLPVWYLAQRLLAGGFHTEIVQAKGTVCFVVRKPI